MSRKTIVIIGLILAAACAAVVIALGGTYTVRLDQSRYSGDIPADADDIAVEFESGGDVVELTDKRVGDGALLLTFRALKTGKAHVSVSRSGESQSYFQLYVSPPRVMTFESYFGMSTGCIAIPIAACVYLAVLLCFFIGRYREDRKKSLYRYKNVLDLGLIVFLAFLLVRQLITLYSYRGIDTTVNSLLSSGRVFSSLVLPFALVIFGMVALSNFSLMRREGRNWRNMLGIILGVGLCLLTVLPEALEFYLQWSPNAIVDVHNESGVWLYIERFLESFISGLVVYLECILLGTVVCAVKAARHVPPYDRDYMLILGCQVSKDGSLTPLLRSRVDRALEFARDQEEKTGRNLVFVPSGGQGADEIVSEAGAMREYLLSRGIPDERIIVEDKSTDTEENIRNSMRLIREHAPGTEPNAAFSTTNYHVFRAGMIAETQGEKLEGIGSPTKRYFWINAFIREFVATLVSERKKHILVVGALTFLITAAVIVQYLSVIL